jgi:GNAT superfamily N-acetyltransferase
MYRFLGRVTLTSGEELELGVVEAPDPTWAEQIVPFLAHKGGHWAYHIRESLRAPLDDLDTRFYVGRMAGRVITQVMIVGARGVGILGHVFTLPEHRRKGAYGALMEAQMLDVQRRGSQILTLSTGFDSHPYWIYHRHGFRSIVPENGHMIWSAASGNVERYWAYHRGTIRPARWDDWGHLSLLMERPADAQEEQPRSFYFHLLERGSMEGPYLTLRATMHRDPTIRASVLEAVTPEGVPGAIAGIAVAAPEPNSFSALRLLDFTIQPRWQDQTIQLIRATLDNAGPTVAYANETDAPRADALKSAGFAQCAVLPRWLQTTNGVRDVIVFRTL